MLFLAVSLVPIAVLGYISYSSGKAALQGRIFDKMSAIAESKDGNVRMFLQLRGEEMEILAANETIQILMTWMNKKEKGESVDEAALQKVAVNFIEIELPEFSDITPFFEYIFIGENGKVYFSTDKSIVGGDLSKDVRFQRGLKERYLTDVSIDRKTGKQSQAVRRNEEDNKG